MSYKPVLPMLILFAGTPLLHGQALVERGIIDGKTAAAAAGAGKSMVGVLRQVSNATDSAAKGAPPPPPPRVNASDGESAPAVSPAVAATSVSSRVIISGMDRAELMKLLGKPSMSVSGVEANTLTETFWYQTATESITIVLRGGKVFSVKSVAKS